MDCMNYLHYYFVDAHDLEQIKDDKIKHEEFKKKSLYNYSKRVHDIMSIRSLLKARVLFRLVFLILYKSKYQINSNSFSNQSYTRSCIQEDLNKLSPSQPSWLTQIDGFRPQCNVLH